VTAAPVQRNANARKPFFAYVAFSLVNMPTLPNPEFAGKTTEQESREQILYQ
jgi:hypothetical protein